MPTRRRRTPTPQAVGDAHGGDDLDTLPPTTRWYRDHGRCTRRQKAAKEQYLTPNEEKALAAYVLRMSKHGFPLPVKVLRSLAAIIRQRRTRGAFSASVVHPPGKNWPQAFFKRNPELVARRVKAMARNRHDHTIYQKTLYWFSIIGEELANPAILPEHVYNMDETGVLDGRKLVFSRSILTGSSEAWLSPRTKQARPTHKRTFRLRLRPRMCRRRLPPVPAG
jgi:hypothetical protein